MRKFMIVLIGFTLYYASVGQNVGIGTTNPEYPLTVHSDPAGEGGIVQVAGSMKFGFYMSQNSGAWLQTWTNHNLHFATNNSSQPQMTLTTQGRLGLGNTAPTARLTVNGDSHLMGNVGINNSNPGFPLDIEGRVRIRRYNGLTAGIWFDGIETNLRSFIGTIDNDHVGIWGSGGAGWQFAMNVTNGNVGVGTSAPTAKLDVNGSVRIRSSSPKVGSVLTSLDANGNAAWADPVAFKAVGGLDGQPNVLQNLVWTKILFNQTAAYNPGQGYQGLASQFVVTEKGIYQFLAQLHWDAQLTRSSIRVRLNRNGNFSTLAEHYENQELDLSNGVIRYQRPSVVVTDAALEVGDIITIEGFADVYSGGTVSVSASAAYTYFCGHLVSRL